MPYKTEKLKLPPELDRRRKLTDEQRSEIILNKDKLSIRGLSLRYKVSRRLIQFILFPDRLAVAKEGYKQRRKDGRYYDREAHNISMRETRRYKHYDVGFEKLQEFYHLSKIGQTTDSKSV